MATALIQEIRTVSGNQWQMKHLGEKNGQTYVAGTPVMLDPVSGWVQAWDGVTVSQGILGIVKTFGNNLTTSNTALQQSFGSVQNESSAKNFSRPFFNDGKTDVVIANEDSIFYAQVGPAQTTAESDKGKQYGMTIDTDGHWFVDKNKTGAAAVVVVENLDTVDTSRGVHIKFLKSAQQF